MRSWNSTTGSSLWRLAAVLDRPTSHVIDTPAPWPQAPHLPLRRRLAIDALATAGLRTRAPDDTR